MKKLFGYALLTFLLMTGICSATTINFDEYDDGTILAVGTFDSIGVHFNQNLVVDDGDSGGLAISNPNYALNADSFGGDLTGYFTGPVSSTDFISVYAGDSGTDTDTVTLFGYDAFDNLIDSDTYTGLSAQLLSISGAGIVRFEIIQSGLVGYDDFTFNNGAPAPTPEPNTMALLALGLLGAAGINRKKK